MISTFVSSESQISAAITAGATHLIIEHSRVTIRSFCDDAQDEGFTKYPTLAAYARGISPHIKLSISIDILVHNPDFLFVETAIKSAISANITSFRIQDIGLAELITDYLPLAEIILAPEIGYHSSQAVHIALNQVSGVSLSNEVPFETIQAIDQSPRLEIQVQGPIMIQYSYRRYLDGVFHNASIYDHYASDLEYPGRLYRFYDSPNGTVMFLYFDRCLLREHTLLRSLNLGSWLVDCRGESLDYMTTAIAIYRALSDEKDVSIESSIAQLKQLNGRPQRPGFFLRNNTDQDRNRDYEDCPILAVVKDAKKGKYLVLEFRASIPIFPDQMILLSTKKEIKTIAWPVMRHIITGQIVDNVQPGDLIMTDWISGISAKSVVIIYS